MSKLSAAMVLLLALGCGLIAAMLVMNYVNQLQQAQAVVQVDEEPVAAPAMIQVVTAATNVPAGIEIREDHIKLTSFPENILPSDRFEETELVIGKAARTPLYTGEVILPDRVADPETLQRGLAPLIVPEGMRAITLRVDEIISVGGFVRPGHKVDILITLSAHGTWDETITKTILQNVLVIATGHEVESENGEPRITPTATVLVTLEEAERLALAVNSGTIRMALRNPEDMREEWTPGITLSELIPRAFQESPPPPVQVVEAPAPPPDPQRRVEVIRGTQKSEVTFPMR